MIIQIPFKTPDAVYYAIKDLGPEYQKDIEEICERWIAYGEVIKIEIDTEKRTAIVVER